MYGVDLTVQLENLMPFLGLGFGIGLVYDILGFFRSIFVRLKAVVFVIDFSFCVFVGLTSYLLFLGTTEGVVRIYLVIAEITGGAVYFMTAGRLISRLVSRFSRIILLVFRRISAPFVCLKKKIGGVSGKIRKIFDKKLKIFQNKLKKRLKDRV